MDTRIIRIFLPLGALLLCSACPGYGKGTGLSNLNSDGDKPPPGLNHLNVGYDEDDKKESKFWSNFYGKEKDSNGDCEFYGTCVAKENALGWGSSPAAKDDKPADSNCSFYGTCDSGAASASSANETSSGLGW